MRLLLIVLLFIQVTSAQIFDWEPSFIYHPNCGLEDGVGTWTIEGELNIPAENWGFFDSNIVIRAAGYNICTIDYHNCEIPLASEPDSCYCTNKKTPKHSIVVNRVARLAESQMALTSSIPLLSGCVTSELTQVVGLMPAVYSDRDMPYAMFSLDGSPLQPLNHNQTVSVCNNHYVDLKICMYNLIPEWELKLETADSDRTTLVTTTCLSVTKVFNFTGHPEHELIFSYSETTWCPRKGKYHIYIEETDVNCPEELCATPIHDSCAHYNGALDQHIAEIEGIVLLCDTQSAGGGWAIIQNREHNSVEFFRNWTDYEGFFGNVRKDYWLGLKNIHHLCHHGSPCELRIDMQTGDENHHYAQYSSFYLGPESTNYVLHVSGFSGSPSVGDDLSPHNGKPFSTFDCDHDDATANCAQLAHGAWWYHNCLDSNLNGHWAKTDVNQGVIWRSLTGLTSSLISTEIKVKTTVTSPAPLAGNVP